MHSKTLVILLLAAALLPTATAQVTAPPNQNTTIATVNDTEDNVVKNTFPFEVTNIDGNLTVAPSNQIKPDTYTGEVTLSTNKTITEEVEIPEVSNWTLNTDELNNTISVGSNGDIQNLTISLTGNTKTRLTANLTGSLSEYYDTQPFFEVYPDIDRDITIGYKVPSDTDFGHYSGKLVLQDADGENQTVALDAQFKDKIPPEIRDTTYPDTMATQTASQSLVINENLEVDTAVAETVRTIEVEKGNETVVINESVGTYQFEQQENTDLWTLKFDDTGTIAPYYAHITVNDTAGNTVNRTEHFDVDGLDTIEILNDDFQFTQIKPNNIRTNARQKAEQAILKKETDTAVNLTLGRLDHGETNSTVKIGVRHEEEEADAKLEENSLRTIEKPGTYYLTAEGNALQHYSGRLDIQTVPQHVEIRSEIKFVGDIIDPEYPQGDTWQRGRFKGNISFVNPERAEQDLIKIELVGSAEDCKGFERWNECISGFSLGNIEDMKQKVRDYGLIAVGGITFGVLCLVFTGLKWRRDGLKNRIVVAHGVKSEHFNREFTDDELDEVLN